MSTLNHPQGVPSQHGPLPLPLPTSTVERGRNAQVAGSGALPSTRLHPSPATPGRGRGWGPGASRWQRASVLLALAVLLALTGCKRLLPDEPERLESFAVGFNWDPALRAAAGCGNALTDSCPTSTGTKQAPLPYADDSYVSLWLDIDAIGSKGTRPFPWTGEVGLMLPRGTVHPQLNPILIVDGLNEVSAHVRIRRSPGDTVIVVTDRLEGRNSEAPTFAQGASPRLWFEQPTVVQIQKTLDEGTSPLDANQVVVKGGPLVVTRIAAAGFNVQDITATDWGGLFTFAYNGVEGLAVGSHVGYLAGGVTEFLGSTQLQMPAYSTPNGRCEPPDKKVEGVEDTEVDESGQAGSAICPVNTACKQVEELRDNGSTARLHRCVPDSDPGLYDNQGRIACTPPSDPRCLAGTTCLSDFDDATKHYCQVPPVPVPEGSFPTPNTGETFPYCGPTHTDRATPLVSERYEGRLVTLVPSEGRVNVEGLPVCKFVADVRSVRSSCNVVEDKPDCELARAGDRLLRDPQGHICSRKYQPCKQVGTLRWDEVSSTCKDDDTLSPCTVAKPGEAVLKNDQGIVCRNTFDDFIMGGYTEYDQWKVTFTGSDGKQHCATIMADTISNFDPFALQEAPGTLSRITGTFKQTQFKSGSSFWIIEVRGPADVVR